MSAIHAWLDAKEHRPIIAAIAIVETPVIAGLWVLAASVGAPWWVMPSVLAAAVLLVGWIFIVVTALGR